MFVSQPGLIVCRVPFLLLVRCRQILHSYIKIYSIILCYDRNMSEWHNSLYYIIQIKYIYTNLVFDLDGEKTGNIAHLF